MTGDPRGFDMDAANRREQRRELRRQRRGNANPWMRLVTGLAILAIGVLFWLDRLGRIDARDYLRWWPLWLIAAGIAHLVQRRWIASVVFLVLGVVFLPRLPFLPHLHLESVIGLWPLLISAAGVSLIAQALRPAAKDARDSGAFKAFAWMGGSGQTIASENFLGGDAVAIMGACEVDLSNAEIAQEAVIDVLAFWGGVEIRVPHGWSIDNRVVPLLGGVRDNTTNPSGGVPRLIVRGTAIMGGVEIRNRKEVTR
jgi:hypothetical protein